MPKLIKTPTTSDDELHCQYGGQDRPQPALLRLDTETGVLDAYASPYVGRCVGERAYKGLDIEWLIPPLRMAPLRELMDDVEELLQQFLDSDRDADDRHHLDHRVEHHIFCQHWDACDRWEPWDPGDYYAPIGGPAEQCRQLNIQHTTTDDAITAIAVAEADYALPECVLDVDEVEKYLCGLRDELPTAEDNPCIEVE